MKHLMLSSALVTAMSVGAMAQTAPEAPVADAPAAAASSMAANVPAFKASDFMGKSVHALETETAASGTANDRSMRWTDTDRFTAERDSWDDIGNIEDVVMTQDGTIRGILVDVGGFLGIGARTVMVDIENLYFVADGSTPEDLTDFDVVATYSRAQLEALPEFEDSALDAGFPVIDWSLDMDAATSDRAEAPDTRTEAEASFTTVDAGDLTAEQMLGATVEDAEGNSAGSVEDLVLDANETVSEVIVDVGGLLGIGAHRVALPVDGANILWNAETDELRIQTTMTQEQLETLPEYQG
jgi:sporulation protein YlmC with PRC-barrel domain